MKKGYSTGARVVEARKIASSKKKVCAADVRIRSETKAWGLPKIRTGIPKNPDTALTGDG